MNTGILFSDLGKLCKPSENISEKRSRKKWCSYQYETGAVSGTMLFSPSDGTPGDVLLSPGLCGWHRIFVGIYSTYERTAEIELKLSDEDAFMHLGSCRENRYGDHTIEDVFWRCADMTGRQIEIGKHLARHNRKDAAIAWLRFVPMTEEDVSAYVIDKARKDTKRIYATNDMHCMLCYYDMGRKDAWKSVVQEYIDSDVEWVAVENLSSCQGKITDSSVDEFSFVYEHDRDVYERWNTDYSYDVLKEIVAYGKKLDLKMCISSRVAMWTMEYPYDRIYFDRTFLKYPECRCIDRDGDITDYLSFVYPVVQNYIIQEFLEMANTGCDAVQLIFTRGWPFILFEQPFLDQFTKEYGEDARELPLDDERIVALKCKIMTDFVRRLRIELNHARKDHPVELHAKVMFSIYDNRLVGLDVEEWAREGLVDRIVSDERRIREVLDAGVWQKNPGKIDLEKYTWFARNNLEPSIRYDYDQIFDPMEDSAGVLRGPKSQKERISEFMELERKYGMKVYIEIMPRCMLPAEIRKKALEIYEAGGEHIGLWDTYSRVSRKSEWTMWRRIGHKEELYSYSSGEGEWYTHVRLIKLGGKNVRNYKPMWAG